MSQRARPFVQSRVSSVKANLASRRAAVPSFARIVVAAMLRAGDEHSDPARPSAGEEHCLMAFLRSVSAACVFRSSTARRHPALIVDDDPVGAQQERAREESSNSARHTFVGRQEQRKRVCKRARPAGRAGAGTVRANLGSPNRTFWRRFSTKSGKDSHC